jgi:hypothetical protein
MTVNDNKRLGTIQKRDSIIATSLSYDMNIQLEVSCMQRAHITSNNYKHHATVLFLLWQCYTGV